MELFDVNCQVGRWPSADLLYHDVAGLVARMDELGIARAAVSHTHSRHFDPAAGNAALMDCLAAAPASQRFRLWPCWVLVPPVTEEQGTAAELDAALDAAAVRVVRLYPRDHNYSLGTPEAAELLELLERRRAVTLLDLEQTSWEELDQVAGAYPALPLVACHVGYRGLRRMAGVLARRPNVYIDLSFFSSHDGLEWLVVRYGAGRVLFGTGAPVADGGGAVTRLRLAQLGAATQAAIGLGNLRQLLDQAQPHAAGPDEDVHIPIPPAAEGLPAAQVRQGKALHGWGVLDVHAHIGPWYNFFTPRPTPEAMLAVMDRCGVDATVVSATLAIGVDAAAGNAEVVALVRRHPTRFMGYAVFNPFQPGSADDVEQALAQPGMVGIKIHPDVQCYAVGGPLYAPAFELAAKHGVPVLTHTFVDSAFCDPLHFDAVAVRWPSVNIILGHAGVTGEGHRRAIAVAQQHASLYLELCGSYTTGHWIRQMVAALGPERVLYGSDFPFIELRYGLGRVVFSGLPAADLRLVLGGNARRLLKLPA